MPAGSSHHDAARERAASASQRRIVGAGAALALAALLVLLCAIALAVGAGAGVPVPDAGEGAAMASQPHSAVLPPAVAPGVSSGPPAPVASSASSSALLQPTTACSLSDDEVPPGSWVTIYAFNSSGADSFQYDKQGDGTYDTDILTQASHSFRYNQTGTYQPTVRTQNYSEDTTDVSVCDDLTVDENEPPVPRIDYSPATPAPGETVTFDPSATTDPDGDTITTYEWDLDGDGEYEQVRETDIPRERTYAQPGTYTVGLRVTDVYEGVNETTVTVEVAEPNEAPFASFFPDPSSTTVGQPVTLDARESSDPDGQIVEYRFDVDGDGTDEITERSAVVNQTYSTTGTYDVTLTVVDDDGATDQHTEQVDVEGDSGEFTCSVEPTSTSVGQPVTIQAGGGGAEGPFEVDVDGDETYQYETDAGGTLTHRYEETGSYVVLARAELAAGTEFAHCGDVVVGENQPPDAQIVVSPPRPQPGDTVTLDASGSSDPDGTISEYRWDLDGDGTVDRTTGSPTTTVQYDESTELDPSVTVVDDAGATDSASGSTQQFVAECTVEPTAAGVDETVTIDASNSESGFQAMFDVDGDGTYEYERDSLVVEHAYNESGSYAPTVVMTGEMGDATAECPTVEVGGGSGGDGAGSGGGDGEGGSDVPLDPEIVGAVLALAGLGGAGYYVYNRPSGGSGSRPPRPPMQLPEGHGLAYIETGTFSTPVESGSVSVTGLGFEPDLILLSATNASPGEGADAATDRTDGWTHGKVLRTKGGDLLQSTMALADDGRNIDAGIGGSSDGQALELLLHYDDPPERLLGSVTNTTTDGFEVAFDASGLREAHADAEFTVLYRAFGFKGEPQLSVGHFRTPDVPGTQSIDLGIEADHVMLFGTNTIDDVDSHLMTDLPLGFSVGDVIGHGEDPAQLVRTATAEPSLAGSVAYAAYDDRALHLQYGYDGVVRGRTTARVTALGERMDLQYEKVYGGPNKLGSTDSKLVSYVAMNTGDVQPAIGHFRLPEPGSEDVLAVELGFRPSMVEFQSFAIHDVNVETVVDAPVSFGWSEGTVIADDGDIRHQVLDETIGPAVPAPSAPGQPLSPGVAASVRTLADGGRITGRDEVTVTRLTDSGFELVVTDLGTDTRPDDAARPLVFYKAWPQPIGSDDP